MIGLHSFQLTSEPLRAHLLRTLYTLQTLWGFCACWGVVIRALKVVGRWSDAVRCIFPENLNPLLAEVELPEGKDGGFWNP